MPSDKPSDIDQTRDGGGADLSSAPMRDTTQTSVAIQMAGVNTISSGHRPRLSSVISLGSISRDGAWHGRTALLAVCVMALLIGSVGLTNDGYASLGDDMARYLMNGVYLRDVAADRPFASWAQFLEYTQLYYARYPALSLGHHPMLVPLLEAPLYALFGISVSTARLVPLASLILAVGFLFAIVNQRYGSLAAVIAGALFATSPMVILSTRSVMAEMPAIALVVASAYFLQRFWETERLSRLVASAAAGVLSLYAKPLAILVAPALAVSAMTDAGIRRLINRDVLVTMAAMAILAAPAVAVTLMLSPSNVHGLMAAARLESQSGFRTLLWSAVEPQLAWPVLLAAAAGAARAILARDRRSLLFLLWVASVLPALYFFSGANPEGPRYTLYWVPALCALAGSLVAGWRNRVARWVAVCFVLGGLGVQAIEGHPIVTRLEDADGYEEAAEFVLAASPAGPTVLFSGDVDTGFFTFFVRKHDAARRLVVLRSDKVFTTSDMAMPSIEDRIHERDEIYVLLHRFGTRYVVLEDRPSSSKVLEWLREELKSSRFIERHRIPLRTLDPRLRGTSLVVFELRDASVPDVNAVLSMHLPVVGQSITVSLADLINRKLLR